MKVEKLQTAYKLLCKKHNILMLFACMHDLLVLITFPVQLKTLSEGTLVAGIHKYLVAKHDKTLYCELLSFH